MPSDRLDDGGGDFAPELLAWHDENEHNNQIPNQTQNQNPDQSQNETELGSLLLTPQHEHWFPPTSASADNRLIYYASNSYGHQPQIQPQTQFTHSSAHAPSAIVPAAISSSNAFFNNANQTFEYDIHQGQHWSDLPTHENATASAAVVPLNSGGDWTNPLAVVETPRDTIGSVAEVLSKVDNDKGQRQDLTISRSLLSPARSVTSASKSLAEPNKSRHVTKRDEARVNKSSQNLSMSAGSGFSSPNAGQGSFDRRKSNTGQKTTPLNRMLTKNPTEVQVDEEQRRGQFSLNSRGPSRVSSISGHSRGENETFSSDILDDELASSASRRFENRGTGKTPGVLRTRQADDANTLPHAKGFSIQIGSENFKLSGASIMSDAPSYFSKFFEEQLQQGDGSGGLRTLYIDRDPETFRDICRHLQGYYIQPRDGAHFVRLFADAQFYSLPRLISQLFESEIFVQIGGENFQIPRDIFSSPGDSPNFFSLGFAVFFSSPGDVFPGLDSSGLLRPPSVHPPCVPNRSAKVFSELLHLLRGYPLRIRDKDHRAELLRDCRYFNLRGLEQRLIVHDISYNAERGTSEIIIRLEDIRQSGISFVGDASPSDRSPLGGWVNYSRPFVDEVSYEIIVEIADESTRIDFRSMRADFYGDAKARISSLFQVVANKMNLPTNAPLGLMMSSGGAAQSVSPGNTPLSEDRVKIRIERDAHLLLDGEEYIHEGTGFEVQPDFDIEASSPGPSRTLVPSTPNSAGLNPPASNWSTRSVLVQTHPPHQPKALLQFPHPARPPSTNPSPRKRKRRGSLDEFGEWMIRKGQWRMRVQPRTNEGGLMGNGMDGSSMEIVLHAVKLDAISGQKGRNTMRGFLT